MSQYKCASCGQLHDGPPLSYRADAPAYYYSIPENERERRCELSSDQCVIDGENFFILGNIRLPIIGSRETFAWTVWVSLSEQNFIRCSELWEMEGRESEPPYFGWLSTELSPYPSTLSLKIHVHTQPLGERPEIELERTEHILAREQNEGISWQRVEEIATIILHGDT